MNFDIGEFYKNFTVHSSFILNQLIIMETLHEGLYASVYSEMTGC